MSADKIREVHAKSVLDMYVIFELPHYENWHHTIISTCLQWQPTLRPAVFSSSFQAPSSYDT